MDQQPLVGDVVAGEVTEIHPNGAMVRLAGGQVGFLHVSEMDLTPDGEGPAWVRIGDRVVAKVVGYDRLGRPSLSVRRATDWDREALEFHQQALEFNTALRRQAGLALNGPQGTEEEEPIEWRLRKWLTTTQSAMAKLRRRRATRPSPRPELDEQGDPCLRERP